MSAEVFISYASKDRDRILDLVDRLDSARVPVWIDQMSIEGATMWSQEIVAAIRNCKVLILAISENSADSENVVKEVALASEGRKRILPVYLESAEIPESMAYQLAGIQRVEFFERQEDAGQQSVIRALAKLGVTVSEEASTAAAGAPKRSSHGASNATAGQAPKGEGAAWVKIAAAVGGLALVAAGVFFMGGSGSEPTQPLGQTGTNAVEQTKPLAKPMTLDTNRVVVLPFKTIGTSGETADLGYGLVSTLTSKLQPLQSLVVIAKESARKFKDSEQSPWEIGQALGAGTIVTGEIQTSGDKIQVNIQLIDANTEALGWGSTFTKTKDEFLDLQNEIATQLASELKGGLAAAETQQLAQKATDNPEAQAEYQAGRREWNKRSKEGFENAIKHFEKAIELDPNYADPYAGLGDTYGLLPIYNFADSSEAMPKAKAYAEEAIKLNPYLASAYNSIAWVQHTFEYDWTGAEDNYKKTIQLNPNYATGHHWYGELLYHTGNAELAFDHLSKAVELDPTSKIIKHNMSICCWLLGRNKLAKKFADEALAIDPYFQFPLETKYIRLKLGKPRDAINEVLRAYQFYPNQPIFLRILFELYWDSNDHEKALNCLIELLDKHHDTFQKTGFAHIYFTMDRPEDAYRWLQEAIEHRESSVPHYVADPSPKKYKSEPRFRELFKKINHPLYVD
jgi:TolB-like protein